MNNGLSLNVELADTNANFKEEGEEICCGYEFECKSDVVSAEDVADNFGVTPGKTNGKGKRTVKQELRGTSYGSVTGSVEFEIDTDLYDKDKYVVQVYDDGSVPIEVVTRPVYLKELGKIKTEVFDYLKDDCEADFFAGGKGGLHMTFLNNHHAELSRFSKSTVTNLIQLTRAYYKEILCHFPGKGTMTRSLEYRAIQSQRQADNCNNDSSRYVGINPRRDGDGNIWGIEVRIPDGTDNWDMIKNQTKFWMAMIRQASVVAKYGRLGFSDEVWAAQKTWTDRNSGYTIRATNQPRMRELLKILENSLSWFGYDKNTGVETNEKYAMALKMQLEGAKTSEITVALGYAKSNNYIVKEILAKEGGM